MIIKIKNYEELEESTKQDLSALLNCSEIIFENISETSKLNMDKRLEMSDMNDLIVHFAKEYNKLSIGIRTDLSFEKYCELSLKFEDIKRLDFNNEVENNYN